MGATLRSRIAIWIGIATLVGAFLGVVVSDVRPGAGVVLVAVSPIIGWLGGRIIGRRQSRPLEHLAATAASFAAGNLEVRASLEGPREVRLIATSLNRMADEVSQAMTAVTSEERRKTQFVSDVSHELRTPLTAIRGAAETLLDGDVDPEDQQRFLSTIASEAERLTRLANDLLQLQRIEGATGELPFRRVDLRAAAERAADNLEPLLEGRGVTLEIRGEAPEVLGEIDRLLQVITNLVDNASRAAGEGGTVVVELGADGDDAVLSVIDDGPGIPEEDLPRLFDRFYKADMSRTRASGGAGLGLAIVRAIVQAHAGTIEAENLAGRGAKLTVRLPALPR